MKVLRTRKLKSISEKIKKREAKAREAARDEYAEEFKERFTAAITRKDFTLKDLAKKDHPYALRHPRIGDIGRMKPYMLHTRSGGMLRAFVFSNKGSNQYSAQFEIAFEPNARYQSAVFYGSKRMHKRNPIQGVAEELKNAGSLSKSLNKQLKKTFKKG